MKWSELLVANSWASGEVMIVRASGRSKLQLILDAETEWRVKWAQRGIGTFGFVGVLCHIVGWSIRNNIFQILAIVAVG